MAFKQEIEMKLSPALEDNNRDLFILNDLFQPLPELCTSVLDEVQRKVGSGLFHGGLQLLLAGVFNSSHVPLQVPKDPKVQRGEVAAVRRPHVLAEEKRCLSLEELLGQTCMA